MTPPHAHRKPTRTTSRARWRTRSSPSSTRWCPWDAISSCWWWRTATGKITWLRRSWPTSCAVSRRSEVTVACDRLMITSLKSAQASLRRNHLLQDNRPLPEIAVSAAPFSIICLTFFGGFSLSLIHVFSPTRNTLHVLSKQGCSASNTVKLEHMSVNKTVKSSGSSASFFFLLCRWPTSLQSMLQRSSKSLRWLMRTNKKEWWGLKVTM